MPHFKCVACKTRLHSAAGPDDLVGDLCPACGALLEPVGELAEIVGFRSIKSGDDDEERWLDDGGTVSTSAAAQEIALLRPRKDP